MNKSELLKKAHALAKEFTGNYSARFALALRQVYQSLKSVNHIEQINVLAQVIELDADLKANVWQKGGKNRIYIKASSQNGSFMDAGYLDISADSAVFFESASRAARWASSSLSALDAQLKANGFTVIN